MQSQALQPVYGQQQIGQYMNQLNGLTQGAQNNLTQSLAGRGALNSGALSSGLTSLGQNRINNATNFMGQVPLMNQQAMNQNLSQANSLANGFKAPYGTTNQSNQSFNNFGNSASNTNGATTNWMNGQQLTGPSGGILGGLGNLFGNFLSAGLGAASGGL